MKIKNGFVLREMCGENIVTAEGMENIIYNELRASDCRLFYSVNGSGSTSRLQKNCEI